MMKFWQVSNKTWKRSYGRCSMKNAVLKNFTMFIRKQLSWSLFLINLKAFKLATLLQRNSTTGVSFKHSEIYKSVCFKDTHKHSLETWNFIKKRGSSTGVSLWILPNFSEHPLSYNPSGSCFYNKRKHRRIQRR